MESRLSPEIRGPCQYLPKDNSAENKSNKRTDENCCQ